MALRGGVTKPGASRALSAHQQRLREKLESAEFRMLNESLYTTTGADALKLMSSDDQLFTTYHAGFARQVARWPQNPLDIVLRALTDFPKSAVVADFGCGSARLAGEAQQSVIHSFDLVAANERVTACDMANVPLKADTVNVAVFCLALMGIDYPKFLTEAHRVLVPGGTLLVAEVASRFDDHNPALFVKGVEALGFRALPDHPFVSGSLKKSDKMDQPGGTRRARKRRKNGKANSQAGRSDQNEKRESSQFFFYFAFKCAKKESGAKREKIDAQARLPPLKPCIYKRR